MNVAPTRFDLLQWVDDSTREAILSAGHRHVYSGGTILYLQGDPSEHMYRIESGSIRMSANNRDGQELIFDIFTRHEFIGIGGMVDGGPRPQTAEVMRESELLVFERSTVDRLRIAHPSLSNALLIMLTNQMRAVCNYYAASCLEQPAIRLAQRLIALSDMYGTHSENGCPLLAKPSQSELASMVGTARQTVNRILQLFQQHCLISIGYRDLIISDLMKLRSYARGEWEIPGI